MASSRVDWGLSEAVLAVRSSMIGSMPDPSGSEDRLNLLGPDSQNGISNTS